MDEGGCRLRAWMNFPNRSGGVGFRAAGGFGALADRASAALVPYSLTLRKPPGASAGACIQWFAGGFLAQELAFSESSRRPSSAPISGDLSSAAEPIVPRNHISRGLSGCLEMDILATRGTSARFSDMKSHRALLDNHRASIKGQMFANRDYSGGNISTFSSPQATYRNNL